MRKTYSERVSRSRRKPSHPIGPASLTLNDRGNARSIELSLPLPEVIADLNDAVERLAGEAGLVVMRTLIEQEIQDRVGDRYAHTTTRTANRWGTDEGYIVFAGKKVPFRRPRVRGAEGKEIALERYGLFQGDGRLQRSVAEKVVRGVSTRNYEGVVEDLCEGYGIQKSSVSRHWKAISAERLGELLERPLGELDLAVVFLDGLDFKGQMLVVGLGIDASGKKHVLGLWQGATENTEVCKGLLESLVSRGLDPEKRYLFVLDGSKALAKAVRAHFGADVAIQRCQVHKERNVLDHLPEKYQRMVRLRLRAAWQMKDYTEAKAAVKKVVEYLRELNPSAAASLEEGLEETLTLHRLHIPQSLRRTLRSTNPIESAFSDMRTRCRNVKTCGSRDMAQRWAATMLLETSKRFRRVKSYQSMPALMASLGRVVVASEGAVA